MGTRTSCCISFFLVGLAAASAARPALAASLSDLGAFTQSSREVDRIFNDTQRAKTYREAIQSYASPRGDFSREFEATLEQLRKLRTQIGGMNERLLRARPPMAFQYSAPSKPTYRFERVPHPLHAIWLLRQLHEANTDVCSARDNLLVDRWTPVIDGASVFSVERDGRYTGITLTLVPVRAVKATYLLVVPNDSASRLPAPLLAAFLRDYRKREPKTLPFALLTNPEVSVFQIERVDREGRAAGRLGPIEGFRLADPMAQKIVASVPGWCNRSASVAVGGGQGASFEGGSQKPASTGGVPVLNPIAPGSVKASAEAKVTVQAPGSVPTGGAQSTYGQSSSTKPTPTNPVGGKPVMNQVDNSKRSYRAGDTTIINGVSAPETFGRNSPNSAMVPNVVGATASGPSGAANVNPVGVGAASRGPASIGSWGSGPRGFGGGSPGGGSLLDKIDREKLSPSDRAIYDAVKAGKDALNQGKPVPPSIGDLISRGALGGASDPNLKKAAKSTTVEEYAKIQHAGEAYEKFQKRLEQAAEKDPKEAKALVQQLKDDFCSNCPGCEYCIALNRQQQEARR